MSRPTDSPDFATSANFAAGPHSGNPNKAKPSAGVIAEGFDPGAGLPVEWLNWALFTHASWIDYLDTETTALIAGTETVKSLTADGTGGNTVAPVSGQVKSQTLALTSTFSGTSLPSSTQALGIIGKDAIPLAWARYTTIGGAVVLRRAMNVTSIVRSGVGVTTVTLNTNGASQADMVAMVTSSSGQCTWSWGTSPINFNVTAFSTAGVAAESEIMVIFYSAT